jgi:hypothetical protein
MIIYNRILPFPGFSAINLFGIIFARREFKPLSPQTVNHERIHTRQMIETLFVGFYLIYIVNFIALLLVKRNRMEAYRNIAFEKEAYYFQHHNNYLENRKCFYWMGYL